MDLSSIDTLFFDLDGTLLGISDEDFMGPYITSLNSFFADIESKALSKALMSGMANMLNHEEESIPVLDSFFPIFCEITKLSREQVYNRFVEFYDSGINELKKSCKPIAEAKKIIDKAIENEYKIVLATNPVFPESFTRTRCEWINIDYEEFLHVTHGENTFYCKPNPKYYQKLLEKTNSIAENTLMIGNDLVYDMSASTVGIKTWLTDEFLGNVDNPEADNYSISYHGSLRELLEKL